MNKGLGSLKYNKNAHTPNTKFGHGDFTGRGVTQPMGKIIDSRMSDSGAKPKKLKSPPKALA